jgi:hypothetical protein
MKHSVKKSAAKLASNITKKVIPAVPTSKEVGLQFLTTRKNEGVQICFDPESKSGYIAYYKNGQKPTQLKDSSVSVADLAISFNADGCRTQRVSRGKIRKGHVTGKAIGDLLKAFLIDALECSTED